MALRRRPVPPARPVGPDRGPGTGTPAAAPARSLATVPTGTVWRVTALGAAGGQQLRLAEFGLRPGARVTVVSRTAGGGRLVGVSTGRVALDRATAAHVAVAPAA